ncbi:hypothetical protein DL93DRAFT_2079575, partial [Clavulina sp. PMI_390]
MVHGLPVVFTSNMHDNNPEVRQSSLPSSKEEIQKAMKHGKQAKDSVHEHAPGWNEVLASVSEANVKVCPPRRPRA